MPSRYSLNTKVVFNEGTDEEIISYWGPSPRAWAIRWLYENIQNTTLLTLNDLVDGTPGDGQVLVYDGTDGEWGFGDLGDGNVQSDWNETAPESDAFILNKPTLFSGDYNDLTNAPTIFSGDFTDLTNVSISYNDLTDLPDIFSGDYNDLTNAPTLFDGDYNSLTNTPTIPQSIDDLTDVDTSSAPPSDGDILIWRSGANHWEPSSNSGSVPTLDDVGNVDITSIGDGDILTWDGSTNEWVNTTTLNFGAQVINDLNDVDTATTPPTDGQVLTWNNSNSEWEPSTVSAGSVTSIDDIGDVTSTGESDGDVLVWNSITNTYENGPLAINDLSNVNASPTDGQVLSWNFANLQWEAATVAAGSITGIDDIGDVNVVAENDGDILVWNSITQVWENGPLALNDLSNVDATPTDGQVLTWNNGNSEWEATTVSASVTTLESVGDITFTTLGDGDILSWDAGTNEWVNIDSSTLGAQSIDDLNDVDTSTTAPQDGQVLTWNNANQEWEPQSAGGSGEVNVQSDWDEANTSADSFILNKPTLFDGDYDSLTNLPTLFDGDYDSLTNLPTLFDGDYDSLTNLPTLFDGAYSSLTGTPTIPANIDDLGDVDTSTAAPTDGQGLIWSQADSEWQPGTISATVTTIDAIGDVNITGPLTEGDILTWDNTNNEWVNEPNPAPEVIDDLNDVNTSTVAPNDYEVLTWISAAGPSGAWVPLEVESLYTSNGTVTEQRVVDFEGASASLIFNAFDNTSSSWAETTFISVEPSIAQITARSSSDGGATIDVTSSFGVETGYAYYENVSAGTTRGIIYANDYSDGFTNRSLIDREYGDRAQGVRVGVTGSTVAAYRFVELTGGGFLNYIRTNVASTSAVLSDLFGFVLESTGDAGDNNNIAYRTGVISIPSSAIAGTTPNLGDPLYLSNTVAGQLTSSNASGIQVGTLVGTPSSNYLVLLSL